MAPAPSACFLLVCVGLGGCAGPAKPAARTPDSETAAPRHGIEWDPHGRTIRCPDGAEMAVPAAYAGLVRQANATDVTIVPDGTAPGSALMVTMTARRAGFWGRLPIVWPKVHQLASGQRLENPDGSSINANLRVEFTAVETEYEHLGRRWKLVYAESTRCQAAAVDVVDAGAPPRLAPLVTGMHIPPELPMAGSYNPR